MNDIRELHHKAMRLADEGDLAKRRGESVQAVKLYAQALEFERQAADMVALDAEPSRSVLYRSAASLALISGQLREAERLAAIGLVGNPPPEIADELRDLLETVRRQNLLALLQEEQTSEPITLHGVINFADAETNTVKIINDDGEIFTVIVPDEKLNDIVRPLWGVHVELKGTLLKPGVLRLIELQMVIHAIEPIS